MQSVSLGRRIGRIVRENNKHEQTCKYSILIPQLRYFATLWANMWEKSDEKRSIGEEQTQTRELKAAARPGSEIQWLHFSPISTKPTPAVQHSAQVRYLLQPDVQLRGISAINRYRAVAAVWVSGRAWQGNIQLIGISEVGVTWAGWWPHWTLDMGNPLQLDLGNPPSEHHHYHQPPWRTLPCSLLVPRFLFFLVLVGLFNPQRFAKYFPIWNSQQMDQHCRLFLDFQCLFVCLFAEWCFLVFFLQWVSLVYLFYRLTESAKPLGGIKERLWSRLRQAAMFTKHLKCFPKCLPNTWNVFQNVNQTPEMFSKKIQNVHQSPTKSSKEILFLFFQVEKYIEMGTNKH